MAGADDIRATSVASFGPFRLNPIERRLERDNEAVVIGSRSLEILIALVERAGVSARTDGAGLARTKTQGDVFH